MNPYFTAPDTEKFRFYRIPKLLFTDERYRPVSTDAKMLYGLLLDRLSLYPMNWALNLDGHLSLWAGIALLLIPTVLMFLGTSYILKNKLNLE